MPVQIRNSADFIVFFLFPQAILAYWEEKWEIAQIRRVMQFTRVKQGLLWCGYKELSQVPIIFGETEEAEQHPFHKETFTKSLW